VTWKWSQSPDWCQRRWCCMIVWDLKGIVLYELMSPKIIKIIKKKKTIFLPPGKTIDSDLSPSTIPIKWSIQKKQPKLTNRNWSIEKLFSIMITPDNTHLWQFGKNWKSLAEKFWCIHRSSNLIPSDYHLFRSLQNFLNGVDFKKKLAKSLSRFFTQKSQKFYTDRIMVE